MRVKDSVLEALLAADGAFVSGGELAATLGVSRNAVWKAVRSLQAEGYDVQSVTGKGHRLNSCDVLHAHGVERYLQTDGLAVQVHGTVTSTNTLAKEAAEQGAPEGTVILAAAQTAGRGRLGRTFCSPPDTGLYMSVVLRPTLAAEQALHITTAAAVAVCRAIERVSDRVPSIKWVNDVFCDGKKVCGILTQAAFEPETGGLSYAVLGIGINVRVPKGGFPEEIADIAGAVFKEGEGDRCRLAAAVLDAFFEEYRRLEDGAYIAEYRARSLLDGKAVTVHAPTGDRAATALYVDEACRLCVRYDDGEEDTLSFGDVSIRLQ